MQRRTFLQMMGTASLTAGFYPRSLLSQANAAAKPLILVTVQAQGGWDTSFMFSPKPAPVSPYKAEAFRQIGPFSVAPASASLLKFVENYHQNLTVIQGIDSKTNNHLHGERYLTSGQLTEGYPHIGALWAAIGGQGLELAFASKFGGYQNTANLVPLTPILQPSALASLTRTDLGSVEESLMVDAAINQRMMQAMGRRRLLPHDMRQLKEFVELRQLQSNIAKLPGIIKDLSEQLPDASNNEIITKVVRTALAYCAADLTIAINFGIGAGAGGRFDSHKDHDIVHPKVLDFSFDAIDYFMRGAAHLGFADRVVLMVVSDFGRTPNYPDGEGTGKGHWPIGAAMVMGAGIPQRVVGAIDDKLNAVPVNGKTLKLDDGGVALGPEHLHMAVRRLLGIADHPLCQAFPLAPPAVDILG